MAININHQTDTICATGGTLNLPDYSGGGGSGGCLKLDSDINLYSDGTCSGCNLDGSAGCFNLLIGSCAGKSLNAGCGNVFLGKHVGLANTTGRSNVYIGDGAGCCNERGCANVVIGDKALHKLKQYSWGDYGCNVVIGACAACNAGPSNGYMHDTVFIGNKAGFSVGNTEWSTAVGLSAFCSGSGNLVAAFGSFAGKCGGDEGAFLGACAGDNGSMNRGVFIGACSGRCISGNYSCRNIIIGHGDPALHGSMSAWCGCQVILIGNSLQPPVVTNGSSRATENQLGIGQSSLGYWLVGNSKFNVGIGTTNPDATPGVGNTAILAVGCLKAYKLYGDGSNLTNLPGGGGGGSGGCLKLDADVNLYSDGTCAGCDFDGANACYNIALGCCAGHTIASGSYNIALGYEVMSANTTSGNCNTVLGRHAGRCIWSGTNNVFLGTETGRGDSTSGISGSNNIAFGTFALQQLSSGSNNFSANSYSGCEITSGGANITIGEYAGSSITSGGGNTLLGSHAGREVTGDYIVAIGQCAGRCHTSNDNSVYIGHDAGYNLNALTSVFIGYCAGYGVAGCQAAENTAVGCFAARKITTGSLNAYFGASSGCETTSGTCNVAIGAGTGRDLTTGSQNTILGSMTTNITTGSHNVAIGYCAKVASNSGSKQFVIGCVDSHWICGDSNFNIYDKDGNQLNGGGGGGGGSGFSPDSQENLAAGTSAGASKDADTCYNIFLGYKAGTADCAGDNNVYIGCCAGVANVSGDNNVFIGAYAGKGNTTGYKNVQIGYNAGPGYSGTGYCNIYLGVNPAGGNGNGTHNFIAGYQAGYTGSGANHNFVVGQLAYTKLCGGDNNIAIGEYAGYCNCGGSNNIYLGNSVAYHGTGNSNNILMGYYAANNSGSSGYMCCTSHNIGMGYYVLDKLQCGCGNIALGKCAGCTITDGECNVVIGYNTQVASATGDKQFIIGVGGSKWICGDSNFNIYDKDGNQLNGGGGGGGGTSPGGSNTQVQYNNSGSFGGSSNLTFDGTDLTVGGKVNASTSVASSANGLRKITTSTSAPSGGADGDIWIKYTA